MPFIRDIEGGGRLAVAMGSRGDLDHGVGGSPALGGCCGIAEDEVAAAVVDASVSERFAVGVMRALPLRDCLGERLPVVQIVECVIGRGATERDQAVAGA